MITSLLDYSSIYNILLFLSSFYFILFSYFKNLYILYCQQMIVGIKVWSLKRQFIVFANQPLFNIATPIVKN